MLTAILIAAAVTCSSPQPGANWVCVNGGWLPPGHPEIPANTTPQPGPAPSPTLPPVCDPRPNPYAEQERAAACAAWERQHLPQPPMPTYEVGRVYTDPYQYNRMAVITVGLSLEGVPVVTGQHLSGPAAEVGTVFAFRVLRGPAAQWTLVN